VPAVIDRPIGEADPSSPAMRRRSAPVRGCFRAGSPPLPASGGSLLGRAAREQRFSRPHGGGRAELDGRRGSPPDAGEARSRTVGDRRERAGPRDGLSALDDPRTGRPSALPDGLTALGGGGGMMDTRCAGIASAGQSPRRRTGRCGRDTGEAGGFGRRTRSRRLSLWSARIAARRRSRRQCTAAPAGGPSARRRRLEWA
jgi:hypothetical protein